MDSETDAFDNSPWRCYHPRPMQCLAMLLTRPRGLPARLLVGLAVLALGAGACGPDVPTLVAALPTLAPVRVISATSTPLPARPTLTPTATKQPSQTPTQTPPATATAAATAAANASVAPTSFAPTPDGQSLSRQVKLPILMYHYVEPWPAKAGAVRKNQIADAISANTTTSSPARRPIQGSTSYSSASDSDAPASAP